MSASSVGSQPIAWFVTFADAARADHVRSLHDTEMEAKLKIAECVSYGEVGSTDDMIAVPLYRQWPPTDAELRAIRRAAAVAREMHDTRLEAALGGLLERLG
jgi:hypothetical protein